MKLILRVVIIIVVSFSLRSAIVIRLDKQITIHLRINEIRQTQIDWHLVQLKYNVNPNKYNSLEIRIIEEEDLTIDWV